GNEENLVGLWNFDDGTPKDSSAGHHDGQLMGNAKVVDARLPASDELASPAIVEVKLTDTAGKPVRNAKLRLEQGDSGLARSEPIGGGQGSGVYSIAIYAPNGSYELSAKEGNLGARRAGFQLRAGENQRLDLVLKEEVSLSGHVLALDGKTPLSSVVVQVVKP